MPRLVLGTRNRKKLGELVDLLEPLGIELKTLADFPHSIEVEESGTTFTDNARLKACLQAKHLGEWVLGEDSGLSVDALHSAPGVYSARFSGVGATDASNNRLLLEKLQGVPRVLRTAFYTCHATLADPAGEVRAEAEDYCRGRILFEEAGGGGFGYDPLFEVIEWQRTFGELSPVVKQALSHRSRAMRQIAPQIAKLLI